MSPLPSLVSSILLSDPSLLCYGTVCGDDDGDSIRAPEEDWRDSMADILMAATDSAQEAGRSRQEARAGTEEVDYEERNGVAPC